MTPPRLTAREREVCALIAACRTTQQIAAYLGVNERRVRQITTAIADKVAADKAGDLRVCIALWWTQQAA